MKHNLNSCMGKKVISPSWIFFLHRSYSNKSNKIYFIFFPFSFDFIRILQASAEINQQIKKNPPTPSTDQRAPLVSGRGVFPAQPRTPQRRWRARRRGEG